MQTHTTKTAQRKKDSFQAGGTATFAEKEAKPIQRKENKTGMPDKLKSGVESLSGMDMSDVRVHYNSDKPAQLQAHAYAQGTNIHLGAGQEKHLPHEAWHVVQQKQGRVRPTMQMKGKVNVNDDKGLEREADVMGMKALQMKSPPRQIVTQLQSKDEQSTRFTETLQRQVDNTNNNHGGNEVIQLGKYTTYQVGSENPTPLSWTKILGGIIALILLISIIKIYMMPFLSGSPEKPKQVNKSKKKPVGEKSKPKKESKQNVKAKTEAEKKAEAFKGKLKENATPGLSQAEKATALFNKMVTDSVANLTTQVAENQKHDIEPKKQDFIDKRNSALSEAASYQWIPGRADTKTKTEVAALNIELAYKKLADGKADPWLKKQLEQLEAKQSAETGNMEIGELQEIYEEIKKKKSNAEKMAKEWQQRRAAAEKEVLEKLAALEVELTKKRKALNKELKKKGGGKNPKKRGKRQGNGAFDMQTGKKWQPRKSNKTAGSKGNKGALDEKDVDLTEQHKGEDPTKWQIGLTWAKNSTQIRAGYEAAVKKERKTADNQMQNQCEQTENLGGHLTVSGLPEPLKVYHNSTGNVSKGTGVTTWTVINPLTGKVEVVGIGAHNTGGKDNNTYFCWNLITKKRTKALGVSSFEAMIQIPTSIQEEIKRRGV